MDKAKAKLSALLDDVLPLARAGVTIVGLVSPEPIITSARLLIPQWLQRMADFTSAVISCLPIKTINFGTVLGVGAIPNRRL